MKSPTTPEAWKDGKARIGQVEIDRLLEGGIVEIGWTPPASISRAALRSGSALVPASLSSPIYRFRLEWHQREGAWYIEGQGPAERGWLIVQGPIWAPSPAARAMDKLGFLLLAICSPEGSA
jgi:hypothetical protein